MGLNSGSQSSLMLSFRGHLPVPEDTVGCYHWRGQGSYIGLWVWGGEASMDAKHPVMRRAVHTAESHPVQDVKSDQFETL